MARNNTTQLIEDLIIDRLVTHILATGHTLDLNDGEELVLAFCRSATKVKAEMRSTDGDVLIVRHPQKGYIGCIDLIYGNGFDLISNSSTGPLEPILEPVEQWVNYLQALPADECDALIHEREDAQRYRWLRSKHNDRDSTVSVMDDHEMIEDGAGGVMPGKLDLDAAIDARRAREAVCAPQS